ncbi:MAG: hypothetical protein EOR13_17700 [Mesorhizobium sp.]|nr:MAG: hypothetical protein EOR13_17700 [Mesorhizobium sp.]
MARRHSDHVWLWAFVDVLLVLTFVQSAFNFLALPQINPKAKPTEESAKPPGQMMVCIYWQGHHDVDLWGGPPDQKKATGYSNKSGETVDLVRDDLGTDNAPHFECEFARKLPDGRWAYNIHGFSINVPELTVHAEIRIGGEYGYTLLLERDLTIKQKQERTIGQFRLAGGKFVPGSMNEVYVPLRSAGK